MILNNFINIVSKSLPLFNELVMPILCMAIVVTVPCILHRFWK